MDDNLFQVTKDGKSGFIDDKGNIVIDLVFNGVSDSLKDLQELSLVTRLASLTPKET